MKRILYAGLLTAVLGVQDVGAQNSRDDDYANIGNGGVGKGLACRGRFSRFCVGWIGSALSNNGSETDEALIDRLSRAQWEIPAAPTRRAPLDPKIPADQWPLHTVQSMPMPSKIRLFSMSRHGLVVARIIADPTGPVDKRYGIGGMVSVGPVQLSSTFYLVVTNYEAMPEAPGAVSRRVADWSIYHVEGEPDRRRLIRVGNRGSFSWCRHVHESAQAQRAAQFMTCEGYTELAQLQKDGFFAKVMASNSVTQAAPAGKAQPVPIDQLIRFVRSMPAAGADSGRIARAQRLLNSVESPAWVTCGVGCCTADESPTKAKVP